MSSDNDTKADFGKALDFVAPTVDRWTKELFKGFEVLNVSRPQKDLIQELTIETMLYNTLMPNEEIIGVLAGIIRKISTKHAYGISLDWGNRKKMFQKFSKEE